MTKLYSIFNLNSNYFLNETRISGVYRCMFGEYISGIREEEIDVESGDHHITRKHSWKYIVKTCIKMDRAGLFEESMADMVIVPIIDDKPDFMHGVCPVLEVLYDEDNK